MVTGVSVRMNTEARKKQVVHATLETIGEYGIQGATISRIAKRAGISSAALYAHFDNRRAILVAALDEVYEQIRDSFRASSMDDPVTAFREICERHRRKVLSQDKTSHAHLFLEFVASAPEEGLREVLREKEAQTQEHLVSLVTKFKERGRLEPEVDAEMVASLMAAWAWTGDVANMMDATSIWNAKASSRLMECLFRALSPGPGSNIDIVPSRESLMEPGTESASEALPASEEADCDGLPDGVVFTAAEAAGILKVSSETVREMLAAERIVSVSLGKEVRIPRRALVAFLRGAPAGTGGEKACT